MPQRNGDVRKGKEGSARKKASSKRKVASSARPTAPSRAEGKRASRPDERDLTRGRSANATRKTGSSKVAPPAKPPRRAAARGGAGTPNERASEAPARGKATPPAPSKPGPLRPLAAGPAPARSIARKASAERQPAAPSIAEAEAQSPSALGLTEEEQIESAKYLPRELRPRVFEEERFLFPETYGANRVRLLVRDPEWLFAYWDIDPASIAALRNDQGERAGALSRLSLRVFDPHGGGTDLILLPEGTRGWYVRTHTGHRTYRAELGFTLPSGEFRRVAVSNTVTTPRGKASRERASRRMSYKQLRAMSPPVAALWAGGPASSAVGVGRSESGPSGPTTLVDGGGTDPGGLGVPLPGTSPHGGASDVLGPARPGVGALPGPSDSFPPGGASDVHRR